MLAILLAAATLPNLSPQVRGIFPLGARSGSSTEVRVSGRHLHDAQALVFARPGITAQILRSDFFELTARVTVEANVPNHLHHYRLLTPRGPYVSVFHDTSLPCRRENEPNNDLQHAQP